MNIALVCFFISYHIFFYCCVFLCKWFHFFIHIFLKKAAVVTTEDNFHRLTKYIQPSPLSISPLHTLPWTWKSISWEEFNTNLIKALFIASFSSFSFLSFKADFVQFNAQSRSNCVCFLFHLQGCYNSSTAQKYEKNYDRERERD